MADIENTVDKLKGEAKEGLGKATGDDRLRAEGQTESAAAGAKDAVENVGDKVRDTAAGIKDGLSKDR